MFLKILQNSRKQLYQSLFIYRTPATAVSASAQSKNFEKTLWSNPKNQKESLL